MKRLLIILLLTSSAFATTTVAGKIQNLGTGNTTSGAFVRFWLRGCGGNQPRIRGTGLIGPSQGGVFFFDFTADGLGNISGTLHSTRDAAGTGTGDIECGGSYTAVWYGMQAFSAGKGGPEVPVHTKNGSTLNIANVTSITTNPVVTSPTGHSTYLRLDAGNSPVTGSVTFLSDVIAQAGANLIDVKTLNGSIQFADQFPGATADVQMNAAIAALPSTGGIVDARAYGATSQTIAGQVAIGAPNKIITLLLDARTGFNITATGNIVVFPIANGSSMECQRTDGPRNNVESIQAGATSVIKSIVAPADVTFFPIMILRGCSFLGISGSSVSSALVDLQALGLGSTIENVTVYNPFNTIGVLFHPSATSSMSDVNVWNLQSNGGAVAGARPCVIQGLGNTQQVSNIYFYGGGCQHAGSGQYEIEIDGLNGGVGPVAGVSSIQFYGTHLETFTGTLGIKLRDVNGFKMAGSMGFSGGGSTNAYTISESAANLTQGIEIAQCRCTSGSLAQYIVNTAAGGTTIANVSTAPFIQPEYTFKVPSLSTSFSEVSASPTPAGAGFDVCYADSTAHTTKCSDNNGSFFNRTLTIGTGTSTSNGTIINAGTSQAQPAITITGATTSDIATCTLNAAPVATWQTGIQLLPPVVTANTVTPWLSNPTAGNITPAATVIRCTVTR